MTDEPDDTSLRDAIRDRIRDLGDPDAMVVGYAAVVEVVTPGEDSPWLKILMDHDSTPWAQVGRVAGLRQVVDSRLETGWEQPDD